MHERRLRDMTEVVVEVVARGGVFDDASSIGSGDGPQQVLDSCARYQDERGAGYCCPRHPEHRKPYRPHRSTFCPECSMKAHGNPDTLSGVKLQLEQLLQQLLVVDSNINKSANRGACNSAVTSPSSDEDGNEWMHRNSSAVPLIGVVTQDWTEIARRVTAFGSTSTPRAAKEGEDGSSHPSPSPPTQLPQPQQPQSPMPHPAMPHFPSTAVAPPPMTTLGQYPHPHSYEPSPGDGPHPSQQHVSSYSSSSSPAPAGAPKLPPCPTHLPASWNPLSEGPSLPPASALSPPPTLPISMGVFVARLKQIVEWKETMMLQKIMECDELRRSLRDVKEEIRSLQVDNAQLHKMISQQGDQMRQELDAIQRDMARALAVSASAAPPQHVHRTSPERSAVRAAREVRQSSSPQHLQPAPGDEPADFSVPLSTSLLKASRQATNALVAVAQDDDDVSYPSAARLEARWKSSSTTTTSESSPWLPFPSADEPDCPSSLAVEDVGDDKDPLGVGVAPIPALSPRQLYELLTRAVVAPNS